MFKRWWWVFLVTAMIGPVLGFAVAAVVTYVMPKKYESEVTFEVKPQAAEMSSPGADSKPVSPRFFGTEFEKIKSRDSLGKVVDHLELTNRWMVGKDAAVRILKGIVSTQNIRGTDLISIRVRHTNKMDARDIAKAVADCYKEYRSEIETQDAEVTLRELNKAIKDQEAKVGERLKFVATMERIAKSEGVSPKELFHPVRGGGMDYEDAKREYEADQALLQTMKLKLYSDGISLTVGSFRRVLFKGQAAEVSGWG